MTAPEPTPTDTAGTPGMVVGTTVEIDDFAHLAPGGRGAGSRFCRTFSPPGSGIIPWTAPRRLLPAGVAEWHSFKDWDSDQDALARVRRLLDTMPADLLEGPPLLPELGIYDPDGYGPGAELGDGLSMLLTYFHEGEKNFLQGRLTAAEWRRRHRLVYRTVREHPHGHRVGYVPIQTGTWTDAMSTPDNPKGNRDVFAWWAGIGDYAGYDAYAFSVTDKPAAPWLYPAQEAFWALPLQLAAGTGRRLLLAEWGVIRQGAPADTGQMRAEWMRAGARYLASHGVAGVAWWDGLGAAGRDFRVDDAPSAGAWGDILAGRY